jgi:peptidoglycan/xylan/chitin deacetylase (PgdA/CDA1 family)
MLVSLLLLTMCLAAQPAHQASVIQVAVTFDDLPASQSGIPIDRLQTMTERLLAGLGRHGITAVGLVNEEKLYQRRGETDARMELLAQWLDAGHELGNHTYSHPSLYDTPLETFKDDVIRGETVTSHLLAERDQELRWFRHPFLRTGGTLTVRRDFESWLAARGYTIAPVTLENWDWMFAAIYNQARARNDSTTMAAVTDDYLEFSERHFAFLERAAVEVVGRQIKHVLLLHASELNADCLDRLLAMMENRGHRFISLGAALEDEAYGRPDDYVGRAGVHWLWRWDRAKKVDWHQEPVPPDRIQRMYEAGENYGAVD